MNRKEAERENYFSTIVISIAIIIIAINCTQRKWENPLDPGINQNWIEISSLPGEVSGDSPTYLYNIDNDIYMLNTRTKSKYVYKLDYENSKRWARVAANTDHHTPLSAAQLQDKIYLLVESGEEFYLTYFDASARAFSSYTGITPESGELCEIAALGNELLVFEIDSSESGKLNLYNIDESSGELTFLSNSENVRQDFVSVTINDDLYIIGGKSGIEVSENGIITDAVEVYNSGTNSWSVKSSIPVKSEKLTASVNGNIIYAFDGSFGKVYSFNPSENKWNNRGSIVNFSEGYLASVAFSQYILVGVKFYKSRTSFRYGTIYGTEKFDDQFLEYRVVIYHIPG